MTNLLTKRTLNFRQDSTWNNDVNLDNDDNEFLIQEENSLILPLLIVKKEA